MLFRGNWCRELAKNKLPWLTTSLSTVSKSNIWTLLSVQWSWYHTIWHLCYSVSSRTSQESRRLEVTGVKEVLQWNTKLLRLYYFPRTMSEREEKKMILNFGERTQNIECFKEVLKKLILVTVCKETRRGERERESWGERGKDYALRFNPIVPISFSFWSSCSSLWYVLGSVLSLSCSNLELPSSIHLSTRFLPQRIYFSSL